DHRRPAADHDRQRHRLGSDAAHRRANGRRHDHRAAAVDVRHPRRVCFVKPQTIQQRSLSMTRTMLFFISLVLAAAAHAQSGGMQGMDMKDAKKTQTKSHHAVGVVKSVDAAKGTLTLEHEPVASMKWPAMTMTFKAKDKKM